MTTKKTTKKRGPAVLVTDTHRGIYFGYIREQRDAGRTVVLDGMRHAYYYTGAPAHEGVYGLATHGPGPGSKIGPAVTATVFDVAKIVECAAEAVERWEAAAWGK